jgi:hypothetical protein
MTNFELNPSKAVKKYLYGKDNNINTMSNLCYEISSSYGKTFGENVEKELKEQCAELISEKKHEMGLTDCYMKRPAPPPIWNQIPHFFPDLLNTLKDPDKALNECISKSRKTKYPNECLNMCNLDYLTVNKKEKENIVENYTNKMKKNKVHKKEKENIVENYTNKMKKNKLFWSILFIFIIILFILV